ncbi:MAG TPA: OB-fold nucleic acid binding domain-containing protein [Candidatus Acidoferrales bacterium]|nr:OB-fold nucleic acid binding domain-containing protein [Candidatus Acidoferrales bacterium]
MKSAFIADFQDGQAVATLFLVREKEIRTSARTGKSWLRVALADRTGTIEAKMWDNFSGLLDTFACEDIVRVRGRVKLYNNEKELTIEQILVAVETDYALADFLPQTKYDVEKLFAQLREEIASVKNSWLRRLLMSFVDDPDCAAKLKCAPAAMTMHHAYLGGLLEHIISLCGLAKHVTQHYPEVDGDLLLAGIVLHDIGKTRELCYSRAIGYTPEGQLLGHIVIGLGMVQRRIDAIPDFPKPLAALVEHLIISHHGEYEFGSPKLPSVREAVLLHHLDDLDSKMSAMRETLGQTAVDDIWSTRNPALRRNLLNVQAYLNSTVPKAKAASPSREQQPSGGLFGTHVPEAVKKPG